MHRVATPDAVARAKRHLEVETWAGRRRYRLEGVNIMTGPRDRLMAAVIAAPNVAGQGDPFRFAIRPAFRPDELPEPTLLQAIAEGIAAFVRRRKAPSPELSTANPPKS